MVETGLFGEGCPHALGLSAGPDRGGTGVAHAVAAGFAFIEAGTVTARPEPDHNPGAAFLAAQISNLDPHRRCVVGANFGSHFSTRPEGIATDWCDAFGILAPVAKFLTINLSAPYYACLLQAQNLSCVIDALGELARMRDRRGSIPLLVKLPFGRKLEGESVASLLPHLAFCGVNGVVVSSANDALADVVLHIRTARSVGGLPVVASGGVRTVTDLLERLAAGAERVQVYSVFAEGDQSAVDALLNRAKSLMPERDMQ